jgi:hypothetical protein
MADHHYKKSDLKDFGKITDFQENLGKKFFDYYGEVFKEGALTKREKQLMLTLHRVWNQAVMKNK